MLSQVSVCRALGWGRLAAWCGARAVCWFAAVADVFGLGVEVCVERAVGRAGFVLHHYHGVVVGSAAVAVKTYG